MIPDWGLVRTALAEQQVLSLVGYDWMIWWLLFAASIMALAVGSIAATRSSVAAIRSAELPWTVLGRCVRPVALGVLIATSVITYSLLDSEPHAGSAGRIAFPWPAIALAAISIGAIAHLVVGWTVRSETAMQIGLWLAAAIWAARAVYLALDNGWLSQTSLLSWCWVLVAGGAHLLSARETRAERGDE